MLDLQDAEAETVILWLEAKEAKERVAATKRQLAGVAQSYLEVSKQLTAKQQQLQAMQKEQAALTKETDASKAMLASQAAWAKEELRQVKAKVRAANPVRPAALWKEPLEEPKRPTGDHACLRMGSKPVAMVGMGRNQAWMGKAAVTGAGREPRGAHPGLGRVPQLLGPELALAPVLEIESTLEQAGSGKLASARVHVPAVFGASNSMAGSCSSKPFKQDTGGKAIKVSKENICKDPAMTRWAATSHRPSMLC